MTPKPLDRSARVLVTFALAMIALAALSLVWLDPLIAARIAPNPTALGPLVDLLDRATGKPVSTFLLGAILILAALTLLALPATRRAGRALLYVGLVQFSATVVADLSKPQLGRLRPFEAVLPGGAVDRWFVGGNAFPSGHVAFYAGLALPLAVLFPRWTPLFIAVPLLVAIQRVASADHYLGDVATSFALTAALALAWRFVLPPQIPG